MVFIVIPIISALIISCNTKKKEKTDEEVFKEILNDPRINSREVGEREGIKYFQVMENGKTGFSDLDGNIVIELKFDNAELFSEGYSNVAIDEKWGLIDEEGKFIIDLKYDYLGGVNNGLMSFRLGDEYGFMDIYENVKVKPRYEWVDEFSEGLCVVRNSEGKHGFIDTTGKVVIDFKFDYASKFENGIAKIELNKLWGKIDTSGKIIETPSKPYATD